MGSLIRGAMSAIARLGGSVSKGIGRAAARLDKGLASRAASRAEKGNPWHGMTGSEKSRAAVAKDDRGQRVLNALWVADSVQARFNSSFHRLIETINITVYGGPSSTRSGLYTVATAILTAMWQKGKYEVAQECIKVTIDRTGKMVTLEFTSTVQGLASTFQSPRKGFHNPNWLKEESLTLPPADPQTNPGGLNARFNMMPFSFRSDGDGSAARYDRSRGVTEADLIAIGGTTAANILALPDEQGSTIPLLTSSKIYAPMTAPDGLIGSSSWPALFEAFLIDPCGYFPTAPQTTYQT